jgi:Undecaprenyl-phosphate galactose phosphotransferase WbaP
VEGKNTYQAYGISLVHKESIAARVLAIPALVAIDSFAIISALFIAFYLRDPLLRSLFPDLFPEKLLADTFNNIWWFYLVMLFCLLYENLYQKRLPFWKEVEHILRAITLAIIFTVVVLYMSKTAFEVSRTLVAMIWFVLAFTLPLFRYYGKLLLVKAKVYTKPVLIIGAGKTACLISAALQREKTMGYKMIGIINDRGEQAETVNSLSSCTIPLLGEVNQAESIIKATGVRDIFIAMPALPAAETVAIVNRLQPLVANVILIPDLFGLAMSGIEAEHFFEEQVLMLNIKNRLKSVFNRAVKRTFDLLFGSLILIAFTPLLLTLSLIIKLDSKGPVFYNGKRIGQGGKIFDCHKYRTMYPNASAILDSYLAGNDVARQEWEKYRKLKDYDPRLTRVGKFIRRFSLDELPQLLNVINGEMSLVGPRPYLPAEKEQMGSWFDEILVAKPGITGLWQVSGRNLISFEGRLRLGSWYVKNWSLWLDLIIILKTLKVVIKGEGAY